MEKSERHFVLVHGASFGAWCWYKVATLLEAAGHKVTALDMAASGIHPKQANEVTSYSDYVEPLMEFVASLPSEERVILVGHSAGGGCISVAMENFPEKVSVAIFAAALMPGPNLSFAALSQEFKRRRRLAESDSVEASYQLLSPPEDLTLARCLMRPYPEFGDQELFEKETTFTRENFGRVRRVYIMCDQDEVIKTDFQKWMIEKHPADEVKEITGSDHMVMFSSATQLFSYLVQIARKYY